MKINEKDIQLRMAFQMAVLPPLRLTRLSFMDECTHSMDIDAVADGRQFTDEELGRCRQRLRQFAKEQFKNLN